MACFFFKKKSQIRPNHTNKTSAWSSARATAVRSPPPCLLSMGGGHVLQKVLWHPNFAWTTKWPPSLSSLGAQTINGFRTIMQKEWDKAQPHKLSHPYFLTIVQTFWDLNCSWIKTAEKVPWGLWGFVQASCGVGCRYLWTIWMPKLEIPVNPNKQNQLSFYWN